MNVSKNKYKKNQFEQRSNSVLLPHIYNQFELRVQILQMKQIAWEDCSQSTHSESTQHLREDSQVLLSHAAVPTQCSNLRSRRRIPNPVLYVNVTNNYLRVSFNSPLRPLIARPLRVGVAVAVAGALRRPRIHPLTQAARPLTRTARSPVLNFATCVPRRLCSRRNFRLVAAQGRRVPRLPAQPRPLFTRKSSNELYSQQLRGRGLGQRRWRQLCSIGP